jgi:carbamate kinase
MPTLHLPAAHTDTDIALAAELASIVGSHELYVTWTHGEGPGLTPEVEAVIHEEREQTPLTPFAEVLVAMAQGIAALWHAILHPPKTRTELPAPRPDAEPRTEEWSA